MYISILKAPNMETQCPFRALHKEQEYHLQICTAFFKRPPEHQEDPSAAAQLSMGLL